MRAETLASVLRAEGFPVEEFAEKDELTDAMVQLNDTIHVTFGRGSFMVGERLPDGTFLFQPIRASVREIVEDLNRVLHPEISPDAPFCP